MCRLFGDVIAARRKEGAAAAEGKIDMLQIFMDLKYKARCNAHWCASAWSSALAVVHIERDQHLAARTAIQSTPTVVVVVHDAIVILSEVHSPTAMDHPFAYSTNEPMRASAQAASVHSKHHIGCSYDQSESVSC
eukprot:11672-Heterococcus_DN1.PRE.3